MRKIKCFLLISIIFISQYHRAIPRTPDTLQGFWVEIYNESSQDTVSKILITFETIKNFPLDSALTTAKDEKTEKIWIGANLCELFKKVLNISCERVKKISVSAPDGYTSVLSGELLRIIRTAICAYRIKNQDEWPESYGYMRLIFPEVRGMYWVNGPDRIVITIGEKQYFFNQYEFYFFDCEKITNLIKKDLKSNPYLVIDDILFEFGMPQSDFDVITSDGLFREYPKNKINRFLLLQKQQSGTWKIDGNNVPHGLKTRQIFFLFVGNKGLFLKSLNKEEQNKWESVFWQPIVEKISSIPDLRTELVLNDGSRIMSNLTNKLKEGQISFYQLFEEERRKHATINYYIVK